MWWGFCLPLLCVTVTVVCLLCSIACLWLESFDYLLELRQEARSQVAVLQDNPSTVLPNLHDELLRLGALALAKRHRIGALLLLFA